MAKDSGTASGMGAEFSARPDASDARVRGKFPQSRVFPLVERGNAGDSPPRLTYSGDELLMNLLLDLWAQCWVAVWVVPVAAGMVATGFLMDRADRRPD